MHVNSSSINYLSKLKLEIVEKALRIWFLQKKQKRKVGVVIFRSLCPGL